MKSGRRRRGLVAAAACGLALAGCAGLGGVRPVYGPVPGSVDLRFDAPPDAVTRAAGEEIQHAGLLVQWISPEEGYVETQWYHLATRESSREPAFRDLDRVVKIRLFADPTAGKTRFAAECVTATLVDPSRPPRELERMVPEGHPGREVLTQILDRLKQRFPTRGGDSVRTAR
jgi:hypothetical protein